MTTRTRQILSVVAFAATLAAAATGAAMRGETREAPNVAEVCAKAVWPRIPAECLDGAAKHDVRVVTDTETAAATVAAAEISARFAAAFQ